MTNINKEPIGDNYLKWKIRVLLNKISRRIWFKIYKKRRKNKKIKFKTY